VHALALLTLAPAADWTAHYVVTFVGGPGDAQRDGRAGLRYTVVLEPRVVLAPLPEPGQRALAIRNALFGELR